MQRGLHSIVVFFGGKDLSALNLVERLVDVGLHPRHVIDLRQAQIVDRASNGFI
jgi:hypothetical protein